MGYKRSEWKGFDKICTETRYETSNKYSPRVVVFKLNCDAPSVLFSLNLLGYPNREGE